MTLEARLLDLGINSGLVNNAIDQTLLEFTSESKIPTTLAFTEWGPTVSLGNTQSMVLDLNKEACENHSVSVLRRDSGGQSVYLDDGYIVFTLVGNRNIFPSDLDSLRNGFSRVMVNTLQYFDIPVQFHPPDNAVIPIQDKIKTIGNSGQVIKSNAILLQGSIRYKKPNLPLMLDVLKINGHPLKSYENEISQILASADQYNPNFSPADFKKNLTEEYQKFYNLNFNQSELSQDEISRVNQLSSKELVNERLKDKPSYKSRGVCYFFVGGKNLVPSTHHALQYNTPSTIKDSTIPEVQYAKT